MYTKSMLEDFDPAKIEDEDLCQVVITLMNLVENLSAKVQALTEENQRLRDENNRLKGEQGKPTLSRLFFLEWQAYLDGRGILREEERRIGKRGFYDEYRPCPDV